MAPKPSDLDQLLASADAEEVALAQSTGVALSEYDQMLGTFTEFPTGFAPERGPAVSGKQATFGELAPFSAIGETLNQALSGQQVTRTSWPSLPGAVVGRAGETIAAGITRVAEGGEYTLNPDGWLLYNNGYIVDPISKTIQPPPNNPEAEGSPAWLRKIQDEWSDKKADNWRKRLWNLGYQGQAYLQDKKGGMAADLLNALQAYWHSKYLNYGKPLRLGPKGGDQPPFREMVDGEALKEELRPLFEVFSPAPGVAGEPSPAELDYLVDRVFNIAERMSRKHPNRSPDAVFAGAQARATSEFRASPAARDAKEDADEAMLSTHLRDRLMSLSELTA